MIRRAQAEALLKLAEALEECGRNSLSLVVPGRRFVDLSTGSDVESLDLSEFDEISPVELRMAIAKLYPKSEAAE